MRFRLYPTVEQERILLTHCAHARYIWNLALEQRNYGHEGSWGPNYAQQSRQLTEARGAVAWLRSGSRTIQEQALRDLDVAFQAWWRGVSRHPTWRRAGEHESFRIAGRHAGYIEGERWGRVFIQKLGWVRFRQSAAINAKSYRIKRDHAGHWWVAFAQIPEPIPGPNDGSIVGLDRGVAASVATSDGRFHRAPVPTPHQSERRLRLERHLARQQKGSRRRATTKRALAQVRAREADRRKDWSEKLTTALARSFDTIVIEDLNIQGMTKRGRGKRGLNRSILGQHWGYVARRLEDKAAGRVVRVNPAFTSQTCSVCGFIARESRESQALFRCVACGHTENADVNAALVIAARHVATACGDSMELVGSVKREPHGEDADRVARESEAIGRLAREETAPALEQQRETHESG